MKTLSRGEVLETLNQGAELWYFYVGGGVAVHYRGQQAGLCPVDVFLDLQEREIIEKVRRNETGYPFYANHDRSDVYKLVARTDAPVPA